MPRPDDVEFLIGAGRGSGLDEDVVDFGRSRAPRSGSGRASAS